MFQTKVVQKIKTHILCSVTFFSKIVLFYEISVENSFCRRQPVAYRSGGLGVQPPPPVTEIPKALQNRAKLNPIVKTVKNC